MLNEKVAEIFNAIAQLLELKGENRFRIAAYQRAAAQIEGLAFDIKDIVDNGRLIEIPGIGKDLAHKIEEIARTGRLAYYDELAGQFPKGILELMKIKGLGAKKIKLLYDELGIHDVNALEKAAKEGRLRAIPGFGAKTEENILKAIGFYKKNQERVPLGSALIIGTGILKWLNDARAVESAELVGSIRRFKEDVHDIDILVVAKSGKEDDVMRAFIEYPDLESVLSHGKKKSSAMIKGVQADVRCFPKAEYGAALVYFTGSKEHNIRLRKLAIEKGLKISEYGVFSGEKRVAGKTESDVYKAIGLPLIPPELREDAGEVEWAMEGRPFDLIDETHIKGDLHMHTVYTDSVATIKELADYAKQKGYEYIAITDHSFSLKVANAMTREKLERQFDEIDAINRQLKGVKILKGMEVDILKDGVIDCPDDILPRLDIVLASVHTGFAMAKGQMTKRIIRAISNPYVDVLCHPTGRLLGEREGYECDIDEIIAAAGEHRVALELNANPMRLDINSIACRKAAQMGVDIVISTDSHSVSGLDYMRFGIGTARRGWLMAGDVVNTMPFTGLKKWLNRKVKKGNA